MLPGQIVRAVREPAEAAANGHGPGGHGLSPLTVNDLPRRFHLFEYLKKNRVGALHQDDSPAQEAVAVPHEVGPPEVVLAAAVAQGEAHGIDRRVTGTIKAEF